MSLEYVFGPIKATDTLLNVNVQFHRVHDRQGDPGFRFGWAWSTDDDDLSFEDVYDIDPDVAIKALTDALAERLRDEIATWAEARRSATGGA